MYALVFFSFFSQELEYHYMACHLVFNLMAVIGLCMRKVHFLLQFYNQLRRGEDSAVI